MKINDLVNNKTVSEFFGEVKPRTVANWLQKINLLSDNDSECTMADYVNFLYFISIVGSDSPQVINSLSVELLTSIIEQRLRFYKLSSCDIRDIKKVEISKDRVSFDYGHTVNWIGKEEHSGQITTLPGEWFKEYWLIANELSN